MAFTADLKRTLQVNEDILDDAGQSITAADGVDQTVHQLDVNILHLESIINNQTKINFSFSQFFIHNQSIIDGIGSERGRVANFTNRSIANSINNVEIVKVH